MNDLIQENNSNPMLLMKIKQIFISNIYQSFKVNDYLTVGNNVLGTNCQITSHPLRRPFFPINFHNCILWNTLRNYD